MDADLQDSRMKYRVVYTDTAWWIWFWYQAGRKKRYDPVSKTIPVILQLDYTKMSGIHNLHDFNCRVEIIEKMS